MACEPAGLEFDEASHGADAVRAFRARPADLFTPEKDGFEAFRDGSKNFAGVEVIAVSGGLALGATAVLPEPYGPAALVTLIRRRLAPTAA